MTIKLRGSTWNHVRGLSPMLATATDYRQIEPDVEIRWEARSLQDFGSFSVSQLAQQYDLMVIDHPHLGDTTESSALLALDEFLAEGELDLLRHGSVGPSFESYDLDGHVWALPIDTAAQAAAFRPDLLVESDVPSSWDEVEQLAKSGHVLWPLKPIDAVCSFLTLAANRGTPVTDAAGNFMADGNVRAVLETMRAVSAHLPAECFSWDAIQGLDALASGHDDNCHYIPLVFCYSNYSRAGFAPRRLRTANIPGVGTRGPIGSILGGAGIAVSANCHDPVAAVKYAAWVASAQVQCGTYITAGGQPAAARAWEDDNANALSDEFFRRIRTTLDQSWLRPRRAGFPKWQDAAGDIIQAGLAGNTALTDAATSLAEQFERLVTSADVGQGA